MLSSAMGKLESLVLNKAVPLAGEVKVLLDDLNTTLHILTNSGLSGKKFREDSICHHSMYEVLDMAHDADVAIDIFIFNLHKSRGLLRKKVYRLGHIHQRIRTIREKIEKIIKEYAARWEFSSTRSPSLQPQIWDPWVEEPTVVGLSKDVELLLQKAVFNEEGRVCVSSIVGMGGVGKTTLAKQVYNHERVVSNFPCRAWVDVSSEFSEADVLRELLLQLGVEYNKVGESDNKGLRDMVAQRLKGTRYFIVLDDVWRDTDLEIFITVFQHQGTFIFSSKTLIPKSAINDILIMLSELMIWYV